MSDAWRRFKELVTSLHRHSQREGWFALNQAANQAWRTGDPTHAGYVSRHRAVPPCRACSWPGRS